jgi:hypothetical protein
MIVDIVFGSYPPEDKDKLKKEITQRLYSHVYQPMNVCEKQITECLRHTSDYNQAYQTAYAILMPKSQSIYEEEVLNCTVCEN